MKNFKLSCSTIILTLFMLVSCKENLKNNKSDITQFSLIEESKSGINFVNKIVEGPDLNIIKYDGLYLGSGVGFIDINKDGLQDIYFASNQGEDKLYLNKGNFKFEDITLQAGININDRWTTGVTIADVNGDGWDDIYITCNLFVDKSKRPNILYMNNHNNTFTERAKEFGIDDNGFSMAASFFDFDLDGDLDLFVANQPPNEKATKQELLRSEKLALEYTSHLYRNEGNVKYTNITKQAGLENFAYSLSVSIGDFFNDGYPDIYVANDYEEGDFLYNNNGDGTFSEISKHSFRHISNFSMGSDCADINNDGWLDLITVDMTPEDHYRNKANMGGMDTKKFWTLANGGHHFQYMFNSLQLNNGNGYFSEIAQFTGVAKTDWSWAALFADFDLDGNKDLFVTNGILKDIRNRDFFFYTEKALADKIPEMEILKSAPSVPIKNYMFRNNGQLHFDNVSDKWGFSAKTFSQGAAYGDLDNDGDLDLVINNTNQAALIYQNNANTISKNNYLNIKINQSKELGTSYGARVFICYDKNKIQMAELSNGRGFISCSEPLINFGLGSVTMIDSVLVRWPDGKFLRIDHVKSNQLLQLYATDAKQKRTDQFYEKIPFQITTEITKETFPDIAHIENVYDDYSKEVLIPYKQSTLGPALAVADVNKDGLDDIFLGGSTHNSGQLLLQTKDQKFILARTQPWTAYTECEQVNAIFFDCDNDGDQDLYIVSGSNEAPMGSQSYQDHLYTNDGLGNFKHDASALPKMVFSKAAVAAGDIDDDGDLDLFVGGRLVPQHYGQFERSAILQNNNGKFIDATSIFFPELSSAYGNVTDAKFADIDNDRDLDLIIVGEWMNIKIIVNQNKKFIDRSVQYGTDSLTGWWNTICIKDLNNDGKLDILAGNVGTNIKFKTSSSKPFKVFLKDFDQNGTWDTYLANSGIDGKVYPVRGRQCSSEQMPFIKDKFKNYNDFASQSVNDILSGRMDGAIMHEVYEFKSISLLNNGADNKLIKKILAPEAQIAPIQSFLFYDFNKDGLDDIVIAGNYYNREIETTRSDAGIGRIFFNDENASFHPVVSSVTGMTMIHDVRKLAIVRTATKPLVICANNNAKIQAYQINSF